jgi:hypothetical protein
VATTSHPNFVCPTLKWVEFQCLRGPQSKNIQGLIFGENKVFTNMHWPEKAGHVAVAKM